MTSRDNDGLPWAFGSDFSDLSFGVLNFATAGPLVANGGVLLWDRSCNREPVVHRGPFLLTFLHTSIPEKFAAPPLVLISIVPSLTVTIHGPSRRHSPSWPL
jgi:hypothetical protein